QAEVAISTDHSIRRNLQFVVRDVANRCRPHLIFRYKALRIELERNRLAITLLGTDRETVHIESQARFRLQQHSRILGVDVAVLAHSVLVELYVYFGTARIRICLHSVRISLVDVLAIGWLDLLRFGL